MQLRKPCEGYVSDNNEVSTVRCRSTWTSMHGEKIDGYRLESVDGS